LELGASIALYAHLDAPPVRPPPHLVERLLTPGLVARHLVDDHLGHVRRELLCKFNQHSLSLAEPLGITPTSPWPSLTISAS